MSAGCGFGFVGEDCRRLYRYWVGYLRFSVARGEEFNHEKHEGHERKMSAGCGFGFVGEDCRRLYRY
jgi:hypothetical protein